MNDNNDFETRGEHPDEAMAAYVDGSATAQERRDVETHLAACARCRREAELADAARGALASLPELDAPRLRVPGTVEGQDSESGPVVPLHGRERRGAWQRAAWGLAGVGAAAAVIAAFLVLGDLGSNTGGTTSLSGGGAVAEAPSAANGLPQFEQTHADYSPGELHSLAVQGASNLARFSPAPHPSPVESGAGLQSGPGGKHIPAAEPSVACVARAAGASSSDVVRVETARFLGRRAFIGTFIVGGAGSRSRVVVVAADPTTCASLYLTTAGVPPP